MEERVNTFKLLFITTLHVISFIMLITPTHASAEENIRDGAYLDIGVGQTYKSDPFKYHNPNDRDNGLVLGVNGRYQKKGFFVELRLGASEQGKSRLAYGYNFLNTEHWSYDFQIATNHKDLEHKLPHSNVNSRRVSNVASGLRILGDYGNTHLRFIAAKASGAGGLYAAGWLSQNYQYNNWNFYSTAGIEYRNEDVVNHFYAINEVEGLPYYRGKAGLEYTGQVGASYPINEDWVFEGFVRATLLPSGVSESPLVDGNKVVEAAMVVKYVF